MTRALLLTLAAIVACAPVRVAYPSPCACDSGDVCVVLDGAPSHCASREVFR